VLDPDPLAVQGVEGVGDVAGGEHPGGARLQELVDEDPVLCREPGGLSELGARRNADPDDDEVGLDPALVGRRDGPHLAVALERLDAGVGEELDPPVCRSR
jgi:hypothetical protein